ncbi:MAG: SurA N-terminal domain-containing protein, partial [Trinickia sp.]
KSTAGFGAEQKVSRTDAQGVSPLALSAIFKADDSKLPAYVGVDLGNDGYAIYRVNAVVPAAPIDAGRLASAQRELAQVDAQTELEAYVASLRKRSKVKVFGSLNSSQADSQ